MNDRKPKRIILVTLVEENDCYRVILDDAIPEENLVYKKDVHFTSKTFPKSVVEELAFEEKDLSDFGYTIWARLNAFREMNEI